MSDETKKPGYSRKPIQAGQDFSQPETVIGLILGLMLLTVVIAMVIRKESSYLI